MSNCLGIISEIQTEIMLFVDDWAREEKTPIPLMEIKKYMKTLGRKDFSVISSVRVLVDRGYIRRAIGTNGNRASYVQLRRV